MMTMTYGSRLNKKTTSTKLASRLKQVMVLLVTVIIGILLSVSVNA